MCFGETFLLGWLPIFSTSSAAIAELFSTAIDDPCVRCEDMLNELRA